MAVTREQVAKLYVANFNRAPDAAGLDYWISDGTDATTTLTDLNAIAAAMQAGAEASTGVASMTDSEYVISLYSSMFGRTVAADSADVTYWTDAITAGDVTRANMIQTLILGAEADTGSATDAAVLANKTTVGIYYADTLGLTGTDFSLSSVTDDTTTVTAAKASADQVLTPAVALTTSTDSLVGTANNDTFTSAAGTMATADTILDSSSTDSDVLTAEVTSAGLAPRLQNIETVNVTGKYATTGLDLASTSGTTDLNLDTNIVGGTATVLNAGTLNAVNINAGSNVGTLAVTATASGTRDTVMVDAGSATTVTITGGAGTDTFDTTIGTGATLNLNTASANIDTHTIHTSGGTLTMNGTNAAKTVTIDNNTTALTLTLTDNQTIVGTGATSSWNVIGNANVTFMVADDAAAAAISDLEDINLTNSGSGTVTVKIADTASTTVANLTSLVADVIQFTADGTAAIVADVNEGTIVNLAADTTATAAVTLDVGTSALNTAYTAGEGTLLLNVSDNQTTSALTTDAGVGTLILTATPDEATDTDADGNGTAETNITITNLDTATSTFTETVVIEGSSDLTITTFTNDATASVLSASGMTGNLTIGTTTAAGTYVLGSGTNDITVGNVASTIHGGSGVDTITGGTAADTINGGAGNDVIAGGATGANTINAGTGDDTVTVTGTATDTITLGAGADTVVGAVNLNYTVSDISTTEDTLVITGAATTASDLTNVTPTSGAYKISNSGGVADFTLTGSTATDVSAFVQLGNSTAAYTAAAGLNVTAGAKSDVIAVNGANTIVTGDGNDAVVVATGETTATVSDFTVGSDLVVITGAAADGDSLDLSSVTPTSGAYTLSTNHVITLNNSGSALTNTDLSSMVQLGSSAAAFSLDNGSNAVGGISAQGGAANDYVDLGTIGTTATTYYFTDNGGVDTITGVVANSALSAVSFTEITGITGTGTAVAANAAKISDAVDGSVYVFADASDGTGSEAISTFDYTSASQVTNGITQATVLADVASFVNAGLGTTTGEHYVVVINESGATDTHEAYAYYVNGNTSGITASDLTLIGVIDTTVANAAVTATDIA